MFIAYIIDISSTRKRRYFFSIEGTVKKVSYKFFTWDRRSYNFAKSTKCSYCIICKKCSFTYQFFTSARSADKNISIMNILIFIYFFLINVNNIIKIYFSIFNIISSKQDDAFIIQRIM